MLLSEMNVRSLPKLQQKALMRLQLRITAETHRLYAEFGDKLTASVLRSGDSDGLLDATKLTLNMAGLNDRWLVLQREWGKIFERAREQAASIPFGALLVRHNYYFGGVEVPVSEAVEPPTLSPDEAATLTRHWQALRQRTLDNAARRIYSDNFSLSGRIWRLEADGLDEIRRTILGAMVTQTSAAELARSLTGLLGAGEDCPRWAYKRLYGMTAKERATSTTGLRSGTPCEAKGLAYKALRLARNEIQIAHHLMNDELFRVSPWVTGEEIRLSSTHPKADICDDVAAGGPYESGEIALPLHILCLCFKEALLMPVADFRNQVRGWLEGSNDFLDNYNEWLQVDAVGLFDWSMYIPKTLEVWLSEISADHSAALGV